MAPGGTKTLDLLIQLQPRSAGFEFQDRPTKSSAVPSPPSQPRERLGGRTANAEAGSPGGLFGAGAVQSQVTRQPEVRGGQAWQPAATSRAGGPPDSVDSSEAAPLWRMLPREVIIFIRDNREWLVAGIVLTLGLIWTLSAAFARRRG